MEHPAILTYLAGLLKLEPETRVEMARHIKGLTEHPGWAVFEQLLTQAVEDNRMQVEGWKPTKSYEDLTRAQGYFRGLVSASMIPKAVLEAGARAETELAQIVASMENAHE